MSRAPSGKILKYTYKKVQKNGDIYVFERETKYDPGKKYNVVLHERLLYKIPKGEAEPVSTRPRKTPAAKRLNPESWILGTKLPLQSQLLPRSWPSLRFWPSLRS